MPYGQPFQILDLLPDPLQHRNRGRGAVAKQPAAFGELDATPGAKEQFRAQFALQFLDGDADSRLGDMEDVSRSGEPAVFHHGHEDFDAA
ncbi:hypothetical protein D9M69_563500 [compost metagenome]